VIRPWKILLAAIVAWSTPAMAQSVQQYGTVTPNHVPAWITGGVIIDSGSSADSVITSFGVTNNGGSGICVNSDRATAAGRNQLCFSAATSGPATISLQNLGTASPQTLQFLINGVPSTPVLIPVGAPAGHIVAFGTSNTFQDTGISAASGAIQGTFSQRYCRSCRPGQRWNSSHPATHHIWNHCRWSVVSLGSQYHHRQSDLSYMRHHDIRGSA
jgi:hypothetical protein